MELFAIKLLVLPRYVHPQTAFSTYRACAIDLEANAVRRDGRWRQVDVLAGEIRRAIVLQRETVQVVVMHLGGLERSDALLLMYV